MDSVAYEMLGARVVVKGAGPDHALNYIGLQETIDRCITNPYYLTLEARLRELAIYRDALAYLRSHLYVTPGGALVSETDAANLKYAVDTNTAWVRMGVKGGAM